MKIKIVDSKNNELDFDDPRIFNKVYYPKIKLWTLEFNSEKIDKFGVSGSFETGDLTIKSDSIPIDLEFVATNDTEFRRCYAWVGNFFKPQNRPFYIVDTDNNIRTKIRVQSLKPKYKGDGLEHRLADAALTVSLLDGLWENNYITSQENTIIAPDATFEIDTTDPYLLPIKDCIPIFTITSQGFNPNIVMTNKTNNISINLSDANINNGTILKVDSNAGLIMLGSSIKSSVKNAGYFLTLEEGINQIRVQSLNNLIIKTEYRRRYVC